MIGPTSSCLEHYGNIVHPYIDLLLAPPPQLFLRVFSPAKTWGVSFLWVGIAKEGIIVVSSFSADED